MECIVMETTLFYIYTSAGYARDSAWKKNLYNIKLNNKIGKLGINRSKIQQCYRAVCHHSTFLNRLSHCWEKRCCDVTLGSWVTQTRVVEQLTEGHPCSELPWHTGSRPGWSGEKCELSELRTMVCKGLLFAKKKSSEMELGCNSDCGTALSATSI